MTTFIQIHALTSYPPANLNRDDLGRPKTAMFGGWNRLRVSSQCLKRTWRVSPVFQEALGSNLGLRTKEMGLQVYKALKEGRSLAGQLEGKKETPHAPLDDTKAMAFAKAVTGVFGKPKKEDANAPLQVLETEQLAHYAPEEMAAIDALMDSARQGETPSDKDYEALRKRGRAADIAMFGRMLAAAPAHNVEAAVQVAHALSVHAVALEDDYFTAVDDLNRGDEDLGAGHIGVNEFAAGVFYLYACIDADLLLENLNSDADLAKKTRSALAKAMLTVAPGGKQNSFGSRSLASFALVERGTMQPRNLSLAFLDPLRPKEDGFMAQAIKQLMQTRENMDAVYGPCAEEHASFNALAGTGSLQEVLDFMEQ